MSTFPSSFSSELAIHLFLEHQHENKVVTEEPRKLPKKSSLAEALAKENEHEKPSYVTLQDMFDGDDSIANSTRLTFYENPLADQTDTPNKKRKTRISTLGGSLSSLFKPNEEQVERKTLTKSFSRTSLAKPAKKPNRGSTRSIPDFDVQEIQEPKQRRSFFTRIFSFNLKYWFDEEAFNSEDRKSINITTNNVKLPHPKKARSQSAKYRYPTSKQDNIDMDAVLKRSSSSFSFFRKKTAEVEL